MIGIISQDHQKPIVEEFFELFKTPWEFCDTTKEYDVLIVTAASDVVPPAKLTIISGQMPQNTDNHHCTTSLPKESRVVGDDHFAVPIYRECCLFRANTKTLLRDKTEGTMVGIEYSNGDRRILHIGYDIFDEVEFLLSIGQPIRFSQIPTIDKHISLLRQWILESDIPIIEVPPAPYGHGFIACLTHDVDFIGIKEHLFDRSLLGFIYRAIIPVYSRGLQSSVAWQRSMKNLKALFSLPAVFLGLAKDFWFDIDKYMRMENGIPATYFFIPFKNCPGNSQRPQPPTYRAARYDINNYKELVRTLADENNEIGLHGIDAWHHPPKAVQESEVIRGVSGNCCSGVRMHWLYFSKNSPAILQDAGFKYDSSIGYNETVGFKSGTTQAFRLPGSTLFELPLNIMDTALFAEDRLALSEDDAFQLCEPLVQECVFHGGALTVNWHTRSLSPERNWDDFYARLLRTIKFEEPWFASAEDAVNWYIKRRSVKFEQIQTDGSQVFRVSCDPGADNPPPLTVRTLLPVQQSVSGPSKRSIGWKSINLALSGAKHLEVRL